MNKSTEITKSNEKWYTLQELADGCGVNVTAVRRWFRSVRTAVIDSLGLNETAVIDSLGLTVWFREKSRNGQPVYVVDEVGKTCLISWLARNQLSQGKNSRVGSAAVEYVTKSAFDDLVSKVNLVLEDNKVLREENNHLKEKISQLLEAPKPVSKLTCSSRSLPAPAPDTESDTFANGACLTLDGFCKYMGIDPSVIVNRRCLPGTTATYIRYEFPLYSKSRVREYVQWVLEKIFNSRHRYEWFQDHPSWAERCGVDI